MGCANEAPQTEHAISKGFVKVAYIKYRTRGSRFNSVDEDQC
jgi:hypothetical protein